MDRPALPTTRFMVPTSWRASATTRGRRSLLALLLLAGLAVPIALVQPPAAQAADLEPWVVRTDGVEGKVVSQGNPKVAAEVWDIEFVGNTAYVAGKFLQVVRATDDWSRVDQPFLAAFDASTGKWDENFRPQLDGPVWAIEEVDGLLVAGGEFSVVNGQSRPGLVALNPTTGATDTTFKGYVERRFSDKLALVRDVHHAGDLLYVIGNFSHANDGETAMQAGKVARFDATTGKPDVNWKPVLAGKSGWGIDTSANGDRVFLGGEFSYVNGQPDTSLFAAVDANTGALAPNFDNGFNVRRHAAWPYGGIVYDVAVSGDQVFLAGAEHFWESRSVVDGSSINLVTTYQGTWFNDTQVAELENGTMYIGCHCLRHHGYANHDINPATGQITGTITSGMDGGEGVWAASGAPDGCLWIGGDLRGSRRVYGTPEDGTMRWVGRFAKFCGPGGPPDPPQTDFALLPSGSTWDVLAGSEWPAGWTAPEFVADNGDDAWSPAIAEFGYGDGTETTVIDDSNRLVAVLGRTTFSVQDPSAFRHLKLELQADDGVSIWLNGQPVVAHNIGQGELEQSTLASSGVWGRAETDWNIYRIDPAALVQGTNTVAVSIHQATAGSRDLGFDLAITGSTEEAAQLDPPPSLTVTDPPGEQIVLRPLDGDSRYFVGATNPPDTWAQASFDDGAWTAGSGVLGFGEADIDTTMASGQIAYYLRAELDVTQEQAAQVATIDVIRDDGVIVYVNGVEVGRDTMPDGAVDSTTLASAYIWGSKEVQPVPFTIPAGTFIAGTNVVAIEVHQAHPDSLDLRAGFEIRSTP